MILCSKYGKMARNDFKINIQFKLSLLLVMWVHVRIMWLTCDAEPRKVYFPTHSVPDAHPWTGDCRDILSCSFQWISLIVMNSLFSLSLSLSAFFTPSHNTFQSHQQKINTLCINCKVESAQKKTQLWKISVLKWLTVRGDVYLCYQYKEYTKDRTCGGKRGEVSGEEEMMR